MPRDLPLANGHLLVNFDPAYTLRDIYWPHVGEQNQTLGHVNHSGVWVDGAFSWFSADGWERNLRYEPDTLVTAVTLHNTALQLQIDCTDTVDFDRDLFIRRMRVTNQADHPREIRLFFHHDWYLLETEGGNTVYYRPDLCAIIAYKSSTYLLVDGLVGGDDAGGPAEEWVQTSSKAGQWNRLPITTGGDAGQPQTGWGIHYWATGQKDFNGKEGTWRDAEDGELGGNPITQGQVDSCIGFHLGTLAAGESRVCYHWLIAGANYKAVRADYVTVRERGPESFIQRTRDYWKLWVSAKPLEETDLAAPLIDLYKRSLLLIRTQADNDGAIVAATDGDVYTFAADTYAYIWPRDGALVANALCHAGYGDATGAFFHSCANVITREGYLLHKYTPSGTLGSSWHPWMDEKGRLELPIQEDETALVVYALWQHYTLFHDVEFIRPLYRPLIKAAADFMVAYREPHTKLPAASWDLWEERHGIHAFTVAAVYGGLTTAANFATAFGEHDHAARYQAAAAEIKAAARQFLWHEGEQRFLRMIRVDDAGAVEPDATMDSSVASIFRFGMFPVESDEVTQTMRAYEARLAVRSNEGGVARYENDY
ncbi:MAG TPA: glycoside hydrolase family 15 protein, partial [Ktedonobacterales bacterium]|nr:glycoside hydrolase family 15 protein [Ktedonobacterales bacterium]